MKTNFNCDKQLFHRSVQNKPEFLKEHDFMAIEFSKRKSLRAWTFLKWNNWLRFDRLSSRKCRLIMFFFREKIKMLHRVQPSKIYMYIFLKFILDEMVTLLPSVKMVRLFDVRREESRRLSYITIWKKAKRNRRWCSVWISNFFFNVELVNFFYPCQQN